MKIIAQPAIDTDLMQSLQDSMQQGAEGAAVSVRHDGSQQLVISDKAQLGTHLLQATDYKQLNEQLNNNLYSVEDVLESFSDKLLVFHVLETEAAEQLFRLLSKSKSEAVVTSALPAALKMRQLVDPTISIGFEISTWPPGKNNWFPWKTMSDLDAQLLVVDQPLVAAIAPRAARRNIDFWALNAIYERDYNYNSRNGCQALITPMPERMVELRNAENSLV